MKNNKQNIRFLFLLLCVFFINIPKALSNGQLDDDCNVPAKIHSIDICYCEDNNGGKMIMVSVGAGIDSINIVGHSKDALVEERGFGGGTSYNLELLDKTISSIDFIIYNGACPAVTTHCELGNLKNCNLLKREQTLINKVLK